MCRRVQEAYVVHHVAVRAVVHVRHPRVAPVWDGWRYPGGVDLDQEATEPLPVPRPEPAMAATRACHTTVRVRPVHARGRAVGVTRGEVVRALALVQRGLVRVRHRPLEHERAWGLRTY